MWYNKKMETINPPTTQSIFKFGGYPRYHHSSINFRKAPVKHILRSLFVNKIRYLSRRIAYNNSQKRLKKIGRNRESLAKLTSLVRPGPLEWNPNLPTVDCSKSESKN